MQFGIRFLGIVIIFLSSSYFGFYRAALLEKRLSELKKIYSCIDLLKERISHMPQETDAIYDCCFKNCESVKICDGRLYTDGNILKCEDKAVLEEFFGSFGKSDSKSEYSKAVLCLKLLSKQISATQEEVNRKTRIWRISGICAGLAGAILLI